MGTHADSRRHRVLVPQALGSDEFLRITWHESRRVVVFSQWAGDQCTAALPVRVSQLGDAVDLLSNAAGLDRSDAEPTWPAPRPDSLVVPAAGFTAPATRRSA